MLTETEPASTELQGEGDVLKTQHILINPVSMTPEEFERQHGPHPGHVVTWHDKRIPPARPPLTLWQRLLPWTRPKLTREEEWAGRQLD